jgi:nicotinamidase-related amidase
MKTGLGALLTPDNCAMMFIDHQPFQFANIGSHDGQTIISNTVALAKTAKIFNIPTLLTTVIEERGGLLLKQLQDVFPEQKPINRTWVNTWEDKRCSEWAKKTGRKKLIISGLYTEICVAMPVLQALGEGYEVYVVTDACGGMSLEAHEMSVRRMVQAGAVPITFGVVAAELQRDWARLDTAEKLVPMMIDHWGTSGVAYLWEQQLLNTPVPK